MTTLLEDEQGSAWTWSAPPLLKRKRSEEDLDTHHISTPAPDTQHADTPSRFAKYYRFTSEDLQEIVRDAAAEGRSPVIRCTLTPHCTRLAFATAAQYEDHYAKTHTHVCSQCRRILPTSRLLHIHLLEVHDSYFSVVAEKQKMYECFVDECKKLSGTPRGRNRHLIDKHKFPSNFDFDVVLGTTKPSAPLASYIIHDRKKDTKSTQYVPVVITMVHYIHSV
ncbi:hypothetical protein HK097_007693 [Rhizophlyctis rosea]|uniref:C2H2-type domain-containing protein n=1 Tax=Rhizophlyctis rosea TaxID=64517 RepID=A0AAD5X5M0_9FUNG|nr:hypothetical protein HK097_007693 [Rhizophlyctis rosea]